MGTRRYEYFEKAFKVSLGHAVMHDDGFPVVSGCKTIPKCLIQYTNVRKRLWKGGFIHFFLDDYLFDGPSGIWMDTERHRADLSAYAGALSPDFSVYADLDRQVQMWNIYRSRLVACEFESWGLQVIPTVSWGNEDTFDFCFKGLPRNSVLAVSTVGVLRDVNARMLFERGFTRMCQLLDPCFVVVYGSVRGLKLAPCDMRCYGNNTYDWTHLSMDGSNNQKEMEAK